MTCDKCGVKLQPRQVELSYLGHRFTEELPCCPKCGMVYISDELASGKIARLEEGFEEK